MLNRRFLRIKVMQALYSFFQHETGDPAHFEKELFKSLDKIFDLYLLILAFIADLRHASLLKIDERKNKRIPNAEDLNPNQKFADNLLIKAIAESKELKEQLAKRKLGWENDFDVVRKIYNDIRSGPIYRKYLQAGVTGPKEDREFLINIITTHLSENDVLISIFEDRNIHWADDTFVAFNSVIRNFEDFDGEFHLQQLLKDEKDDMDFMSQLFNATIVHREEFEKIIDKHTRNWEIERIASMDMLLMEMALAEILYIPNVPVKASLNEYIDISKEYSTPSSKIFVNGVLDKVIASLRTENRIQKTGRGLKES